MIKKIRCKRLLTVIHVTLWFKW